jgi:hypothetical protein
MKRSPRWIIATSLLGSLASAQSNAVPGLDVRLSAMREISTWGRSGSFPNGVNAVVIETTVCNEGTVEVPWFQAMNPHHPMIAFLIASVRDGRIVQISDRSHVKHSYFALAGRGCQATCVTPADFGKYLGLGCSDTYARADNADSYYLGPPEEIDPWLGRWQVRCSLFDRGFPDVGAPENCDGRRSLTRTAANLQGMEPRMQVSDQDFVRGGTLCFQGQYVIEGMSDAARDNSLGSRTFDATFTGVFWDLVANGNLVPGTVLQRWPGATITSNTNGDQDGRVYVGVEVTGPVEGFYHYEYALHNRDNQRGVGALRIPKCFGARVRAAGFRDIDGDAANDWGVRVKKDEIEFTSKGSPLAWNTIYNFWFESDAAPSEVELGLMPFEARPDETGFFVPSHAPTALYNAHLGQGCAKDTPPTLYATGSPARAELGNATFGVASSGNQPLQLHFLFHGPKSGTRDYLGCTLWTGAGPANLVSVARSDASGVATHLGPIPNDIALEGKVFRFQAVGVDAGRGLLYSDFELSEGLLVRVGNAIPECP